MRTSEADPWTGFYSEDRMVWRLQYVDFGGDRWQVRLYVWMPGGWITSEWEWLRVFHDGVRIPPGRLRELVRRYYGEDVDVEAAWRAFWALNWQSLEESKATLAHYVEQFEGDEADDLPDDPDPGWED